MPSAIRTDHPIKPNTLLWSGTDNKTLRHHIIHLEDEDIAEIKTAPESWKNGMNVSLASITKETFPLPNLASRLEELALNLHEGSGFAVLRGLDTKELSAEDNMLIYLGICSWVGSQRGKCFKFSIIRNESPNRCS